MDIDLPKQNKPNGETSVFKIVKVLLLSQHDLAQGGRMSTYQVIGHLHVYCATVTVTAQWQEFYRRRTMAEKRSADQH